jgi:hypothetical protein
MNADKKASVAGTIMEPVFWSQPHSKHREVSPLALIINPVCMKKVSSYNVRAYYSLAASLSFSLLSLLSAICGSESPRSRS